MLIYFPAKGYPEPTSAREYLRLCITTAIEQIGIRAQITPDRHCRRGLKVNLIPGDSSEMRTPSGRLRKNSSIPYALRSSRGMLMSRYVCWHGHRDFLRAIFELSPDTYVRTKLAHYKGKNDFAQKYPDTYYTNVGSSMYPSAYGNNCDC